MEEIKIIIIIIIIIIIMIIMIIIKERYCVNRGKGELKLVV